MSMRISMLMTLVLSRTPIHIVLAASQQSSSQHQTRLQDCLQRNFDETIRRIPVRVHSYIFATPVLKEHAGLWSRRRVALPVLTRHPGTSTEGGMAQPVKRIEICPLLVGINEWKVMVSTSSVQREEEKKHVVKSYKKKDVVWRNEKDKKKNRIAKYRSE